MYQGVVDLAEEDLHSFLEAAEDLDIRGLSETNTESLFSNREIPFEPTHQDMARELLKNDRSQDSIVTTRLMGWKLITLSTMLKVSVFKKALIGIINQVTRV